jgi:hypothetical protein
MDSVLRGQAPNGQRAPLLTTAAVPLTGTSPAVGDLPEGDWIRGITIRQPWATCILAGKSPENRPVHWLMASSRSLVRVDQAPCVEDMSSTLY